MSRPRGRLLAALAGCLVLVMILAALGLRRPLPRPAVDYRGDCDLFVTKRGGEILAEPQVLGGIVESLRRDDRVYLLAELQDHMTAYLYVLQIDSRGRAKALFPVDWAPGRLPATESERADLRIPQAGAMAMDQEAPPGLETLICFVRPEPITREHNDLLWQLFTGGDFAWEQPTAFQDVFVSFEDGKRTVHRGVDPSSPEIDKDPVSQSERILRALKDRGVAAYSRAMCYPLVDPPSTAAKTGKER